MIPSQFLTNISERIRQIKSSNEILSHGVSELEALFLRIELRSVHDIDEAKLHAMILSDNNRYLAHSINNALKDIESILKHKMDAGADVKEVVNDFITVLRESIRALHEYQLVDSGYKTHLQPISHKLYRKNNSNVSPLLQRVLKVLFVCGSGHTIQD